MPSTPSAPSAPPPAVVASTVRRLVESPWAEDDRERQRQFEAWGVVPHAEVPDHPRWGVGIPGWGDALMCWSWDDRVGLVGVGWFLWGSLDAAAREAAATALMGSLSAEFGRPSIRDGQRCEWRIWELPGVTVEFCPCGERVQVHVLASSLAVDESEARGIHVA